MTYLIVLAIGVAIGAAVVAWTDRYINAESKWTLATAQKVREQADQMLATAEVQAVRAEALTTPTGEYLAVKPKVTVRLGSGYRLARDWARELFTADATPDWQPGEIAALPPSRIAPAKPLRARGGLPQSRLSWPLRRPSPSPLVMPKWLAPTSDRLARVRTLARSL